MEVVVEDKQLSLAIGKKGQNVRLAAKLTGWRIDIKSEEEKRREVEAQFGALEIGERREAGEPRPRPRRAEARRRGARPARDGAVEARRRRGERGDGGRDAERRRGSDDSRAPRRPTTPTDRKQTATVETSELSGAY